MAHSIALDVTHRTAVGKQAQILRREGILPGVVYGYKMEALPIQVDRRTFEHVYRRAGATTLIDLRIDAGAGSTKVFVHEVTRDPVHHVLTHVDFMAVNMSQPITADVAIVLVGEAPAVQAEDGIVLQQLEALHVRALPDRLPANVEVDISGLTELGQALHVSDLHLPADVEVLADPDTEIVHIGAPRVVAEEAAEAGEAAEATEEASEAGEG